MLTFKLNNETVIPKPQHPVIPERSRKTSHLFV